VIVVGITGGGWTHPQQQPKTTGKETREGRTIIIIFIYLMKEG